jgi:hypothetical protein
VKRPSFQFYPGDWQVNSNLRRCTHAEKGAWVDVMVLMHDQDDEYGVLRWPLKEIAQSIGAPVALLRGLVAKGVLKGSDSELTEAYIYTPRSGRKDGEPVTLIAPQPGPVWYSSRMVKDEYVRTIRGEASRFGADDGDAPKAQSKPAPKPPFGDGSSSSSSSSKKTSSSARGARRCPDDFVVAPDLRAWAAEHAPGLDLERETSKFRDYTFSSARTDWSATWRNWIREAYDRRGNRMPMTQGDVFAGAR